MSLTYLVRHIKTNCIGFIKSLIFRKIFLNRIVSIEKKVLSTKRSWKNYAGYFFFLIHHVQSDHSAYIKNIWCYFFAWLKNWRQMLVQWNLHFKCKKLNKILTPFLLHFFVYIIQRDILLNTFLIQLHWKVGFLNIWLCMYNLNLIEFTSNYIMFQCCNERYISYKNDFSLHEFCKT